jgi:serine/threonine protein kinase
VLRFLRELRTAANVRSPHIVQVIDIGEHPVPYLVMERLEGMTLAEMMRGRRALSPDEVIELVAQVGAGITAASAAGIVHRDLKPQNVFLDRGTWKVLDFGVARAMDAGDRSDRGHAELHGAGASERRPGQPLDGSLRARRDRVSRAHRSSALRRG